MNRDALSSFLLPAQPELMRRGKPVVYTVLRHALINLLADALPQGHSALKLGSGVAGLDLGGKDGAYITLANGERAGPYDLIVGADGIRSRVRAAAFSGSSSSAPIYSGIKIVFGVGKESTRRTPTEAHQWFADGMYALCYSAGGAASGGKRDVLAVCQQDAAGSSAGENPDWNAGEVSERRTRNCVCWGGHSSCCIVLIRSPRGFFFRCGTGW